MALVKKELVGVYTDTVFFSSVIFVLSSRKSGAQKASMIRDPSVFSRSYSYTFLPQLASLT